MTRDQEARKITTREAWVLGRVNSEDETAAVAGALATQLVKDRDFTHAPALNSTTDPSRLILVARKPPPDTCPMACRSKPYEVWGVEVRSLRWLSTAQLPKPLQ